MAPVTTTESGLLSHAIGQLHDDLTAGLSQVNERLDEVARDVMSLRLDQQSMRQRQQSDEATTAALAGRRARWLNFGKWTVGTLLALPFGILSVVQLVQAIK